MSKVNCKKVSWEEVEEWSRIISNKIYDSGWIPNIIVAISRGGYVPARLICDRLVIGQLVSLQVSHWPSAAQMAKEAGVKYPLICQMNGMRVLVVDDISDTGDSIIVARDHIWTNCRPDDMRVATLQWISTSSKVQPEYYAEEVKDWLWYQYPWTRLEDVIGFMKRIIGESSETEKWTLDDIAARFPDWYGVTFDKWFFEKAAENLIKNGYLTKRSDGSLILSK